MRNYLYLNSRKLRYVNSDKNLEQRISLKTTSYVILRSITKPLILRVWNYVTSKSKLQTKVKGRGDTVSDIAFCLIGIETCWLCPRYFSVGDNLCKKNEQLFKR